MSENTLTMKQLLALAGDDEGVAVKAGGRAATVRPEGGSKDAFAPYLGQAMLVEITDQKVVTNARKSGPYANLPLKQIQLTVKILGEDGETVLHPRSNVWVDLPVFDVEVRDALSTEALATLKAKSGDSLSRLLRAAMPDMFNVYASIDKSTKDWQYLDSEGNALSTAERTKRAEQIGRAIIGAAEGMDQGKFSLVGTRTFIKKVQGSKPGANGNLPVFTNFQANNS